MKLVIEVDLGNEAMQTAADTLDALGRSLYDPLLPEKGGTIIDANGNSVGSWEVET